MPEVKVKHGTVQNIYRIVNDGHDDLDLTRAEALKVYEQLHAVLFPSPTPLKPKRKARG